MLIRERRYSKEEIARRGDEIYQREIQAKVEFNHKGKFVVIDVETGVWEMDADALAACDRLIARLPEAQTWLIRIGMRAVHHLGGPRRSVVSV